VSNGFRTKSTKRSKDIHLKLVLWFYPAVKAERRAIFTGDSLPTVERNAKTGGKMKKGLFFVFISLLGLVLGFQYLFDCKEVKKAKQGGTQLPESAGTPLPPEVSPPEHNSLATSGLVETPPRAENTSGMAKMDPAKNVFTFTNEEIMAQEKKNAMDRRKEVESQKKEQKKVMQAAQKDLDKVLSPYSR